MRRRRMPEVIGGVVNADGTIARGDQFTVTKNSTGSFAVFLPSGFRPVAASAHCYLNVAVFCTTILGSASPLVQIDVWNVSQVHVDQAFTFMVLGVQQ